MRSLDGRAMGRCFCLQHGQLPRSNSLPGYSPRRYDGVEPSENGPRNFGRSGPYHSMAARVTCLPCIDTALFQRVTCCCATAQAHFD